MEEISEFAFAEKAAEVVSVAKTAKSESAGGTAEFAFAEETVESESAAQTAVREPYSAAVQHECRARQPSRLPCGSPCKLPCEVPCKMHCRLPCEVPCRLLCEVPHGQITPGLLSSRGYGIQQIS